MNNMRDVKAGEREAVQAYEITVRKNVESMMVFSNDTRKMVVEQHKLFEILQNHVMMQKNEIGELRQQLASLQQSFAARGTKVYKDGD